MNSLNKIYLLSFATFTEFQIRNITVKLSFCIFLIDLERAMTEICQLQLTSDVSSIPTLQSSCQPWNQFSPQNQFLRSIDGADNFISSFIR